MTPIDTIVTTVVAPNGPGGIDGPPIPVGVARITRLRPGGAAIVATFNPPRADLLDADLSALTDDEIAKLGRVET